MIHTVKGFGVVNKAEVDIFLELSCFFDDPVDVGNLISGSTGSWWRVMTKLGPLEKRMASPMNSMKRQKDRTLKGELLRLVGAQYAIGEQWRNNSRNNEETEPKQKQHPVVDMTGDGSKVQCCKEQYCIGTWNVRSMNQGKLEVFKQEMARVNIDVIGISELKWTGMGEFNSDDHYIYYSGQVSLRRNGVAIIVNKNLKCSTWMQSQKQQNDLCSFPRQNIQYHGNPSLCPNQ